MLYPPVCRAVSRCESLFVTALDPDRAIISEFSRDFKSTSGRIVRSVRHAAASARPAPAHRLLVKEVSPALRRLAQYKPVMCTA
jgi:hypothetical protein